MPVFADLLREFREELARDWRRDVRSLAKPAGGAASALVQDAPHWIDAIAAACERFVAGELTAGTALDGVAASHHDRGAHLVRAVKELAVLRDGIAQRLSDEARTLHDAIDASIVTVVARHAVVCESALRAFEAISDNMLAARDVDDLLRRLLDVLVGYVDTIAGAEIFEVVASRDVVRRRASTADIDSPPRLEALARAVATRARACRAAGALAVPLVERHAVVGAIVAWTSEDRPLSAVARRLVHAVAVVAACSLYEERVRVAAENQAAQQRFLADASRALASSLDIRETLDRIAWLAVPALADWCIVDLVEERARRRVAIAHEDPAKVELARAWAEKYTIDSEGASAFARLIDTGEPLYVPELTDDMLVAAIHDPELLADVRALGLRSVIVAPLVARGHILGAITLAFTHQSRRFNDADRELALELGRRAGLAVDNARLYHASQQAVHMREELLAVVSHDLRNPLGAVDLSATNLMTMHGDDPRSRKALEIIRRASERMERLIRDLLDLARIQSGTLALELKTEDIGRLIDEVADGHDARATERGIALVRAHELAAVMISCDRNRIVQVLSNLIGNALKFCRPGDRVVLRGTVADADVQIDVDDNGPGVSAADLPHVFDAYFSAPGHATRGTGLGLYIAKGIVDAHGGTIVCRNVPGQGACFRIRLPRFK
jgi:signal transduction histidine kinase